MFVLPISFVINSVSRVRVYDLKKKLANEDIARSAEIEFFLFCMSVKTRVLDKNSDALDSGCVKPGYSIDRLF